MNTQMPHRYHMPRTALRAGQRGSSLLEVLVAILIFSLGLLGMAGLSVTSLSYNKSAQVRNVGLMLVNSYAERARLNTAGFDAGSYAIAKQTAAPTSKPTDVYVTSSTAADSVATYDKNTFLYNAANRLPQGSAFVTTSIDATAGSRERTMDVWILWHEQDESMININSGKCPSGVGGDINNCMYFRVVL